MVEQSQLKLNFRFVESDLNLHFIINYTHILKTDNKERTAPKMRNKINPKWRDLGHLDKNRVFFGFYRDMETLLC